MVKNELLQQNKYRRSKLPIIISIVALLAFIIWQVVNLLGQTSTMLPTIILVILLSISLLFQRLENYLHNIISPFFFNLIKNIFSPGNWVETIYGLLILCALIVYNIKYETLITRIKIQPDIQTPIDYIKQLKPKGVTLVEGAAYLQYNGLRPKMIVVIKNIGAIDSCQLYIGEEGWSEGLVCTQWCTIHADTITIEANCDLPPKLHWAHLNAYGFQGYLATARWFFMPTIYIDFGVQRLDLRQDPPQTWQFVNGEAVGERWHKDVLPTFLTLTEVWDQSRIVVETDCYFERAESPVPGGLGVYLPGGYSCIFRDGSKQRIAVRRWGSGRQPEATGTYLASFRTYDILHLKVRRIDGDIACYVWDQLVLRWIDYYPASPNYGVALGVWNTRGHFLRARIYCPPSWEY